MRICRLSFFILILLFLFIETGQAANEAAQTLTLDGIFYHKGTTTPLAESNISVKIQILDPSKTCLLYEESQTVDTSSTKGYFNLLVGSSTGSSKRTASDPGRTMAQVFQNLSAITAVSVPGQTCAGNSYSPSAGDTRYFRITVTSASLGVADTLTPDIVMNSVPSAIVAQSLQGLERSNVLTVNNSGSVALTQGNLEALFTTPGYTYLQAILNGHFMQTDSSGASLPSYASSPSGASTGDIWYDSTTNQIKYQSNVGEQTLGTSTGGISSISTGSAISINGSVAGAVSSGSATIDLSNTGVTAGTYAKVTVDAKGRVTAGSVSLTEAELPVIVTAGKVSGNAITSGTISGSTGINTSGNLVTSATVSGLTVQATNLRIYNGSHYFQFTAQAMSSDITFALPTAVGISGQVLSTDGVGTLSWITPSSGTSGTISVGQGGTGTTSYTANRLIASNGTGTALVATSCGLNQVISFDGSGNITCANVNSLAGMIMNGGNTTAGTISIGTNDNQALSFKTNNTVAMTISQSGNVGIGTTTPGTKLAVSSATANTGLVDFSNSNNATLTAATNVNMYSNYTAFGSAATGDLIGQKVTNYLTHSIDSPSANLVGLDIINTKNSANTMGDMIGLRVTSNHIDATGSGIKTNNIYGVKNSLSVMTGASDSVQNAYGEYISTSLSSGTLTNSYGLYVGTIQGTNKWSIYSSDSTTPSYLAGNLGLGTTSPTTALDVSGAITARGMSSAPAVSASNTGRIYYDYSANKFKVSQNGGAYTDLVNASAGSGFANGGNAFSGSATLGTTDNHSLGFITNNTTAMTISQSGYVGIGSSPTSGVRLTVSNTTSDTTVPVYGIASSLVQTGSVSQANSIIGGQFFASSFTTGTPTMSEIAGSYSKGMLSVLGGTPTASVLTGAKNEATFSGGGTAIAAHGSYNIVNITAGGTATSAYGVYSSISNSGTTTNAYGVYTGTIGGTNKHSIYASDATAPSYFAGNVGVGVISPTSSLDISGALTAQGMSSAPSVSASNTGRIYYDYSANKFKVSQNGGAYTDLVNASAGSGFANGGNAFSGSATLGTTDNHSLGFITNNTTAMTISQSGNVGIGTTAPSFALSIGDATANDGAIMARGYGTVGTNGQTLSVTGAGTRMFWYPKKAAFRSGAVTASAWDDSNIGQYSVGLGYNTQASGFISTALGYQTTASGTGSTSFGQGTSASGGRSTAMGLSTVASGSYSTAMGQSSIASGDRSTAMGGFTTAESMDQVTVGAYNMPIGTESASAWVATDPLFVVGNGTGPGASRSNALMILKNGNVGIGTSNPSQPLEVVGTVQATDFVSTSDRRLKRDIASIEDALSKIVQINGVTWKWLSDGTTDMGVIAQDVEKVFPELVVTNSYGKKSVKYGNLVGPLIEAVKSLKAEIEALKSSNADKEAIQALKAENQDLKLRLEKLEKRLDATEGKVEGR